MPGAPAGIRHHHHFVLPDGVAAKGLRARRAGCLQAAPRLEPLTLLGHQRDQRNFGPEERTSQFRHKIAEHIGLRVQHTVAIQYRKALLLMRCWRVLLEGRRQRGRQAEEVCVHVVALFRK
jgi:hypothetical protein